MANKLNQSEVYSAGKSPTCVLHGEQLKHVEKKLKDVDDKINDLHKSLYQNGFQNKITTIASDSRIALDRIKTNNRLVWTMLGVVITTAAYIVFRHDILGK